MEASAKPSDGGLAGWPAVLAFWTRKFIMVGTTKALGIMLTTLQYQLHTTTWLVGWIASLIPVAAGLTGITAGFFGRRFGTGGVLMACGTLISIGFIAGSFATSAVQFAFILILFMGTGFGIARVLTKEAVGRTFNKNFALATGIAQTGGSCGLIAFPPFVQLVLNTYGWRGTMLLMGGISMHFIVCGALLVAVRPVHNRYQEVPDDSCSSDQERNMLTCCMAVCKSLSKNFNLELFRDLRFWCVAVISCGTYIASQMWIVYFVSMAQSNGFSLAEATTFLTVGGIGSLIGNAIQGILVDREIMSSWSLLVILTLTNTAAYCAMPWLTLYWLVMTSQVIGSGAYGASTCLAQVLTKQIMGVEKLAGAYGCTGIVLETIGFSLGFLPGLMYDMSGDYKASFAFIGSIQFLSVISLFGLKYLMCCGRSG